MRKKQTTPVQVLGRVALYVALFGWLGTILAPYLIMLLTSVTPQAELQTAGASLLPKSITLDAYRDLVTGTDFLIYLRNSLIVVAIAVPLTLTVATGAAIALSRFDFPGKKYAMTGMLLAQLFPAVLLVVSLQGQLRTFVDLDYIIDN